MRTGAPRARITSSRDALKAAFADHPYWQPGAGSLHYAIEDLPLRLIALDSLVPGEGGGRIGDAQLTWLDAKLGEARRQGMGVLNAAVYGGGILAHRDDEGSPTTYGYRPAPQPVLDAVSAMRAVCARYGTDLPTAALQFSVRDETFASTIVGMSRPERIAPTVAAAQQPLPADLFAELETLLPARELWLDAPL